MTTNKTGIKQIYSNANIMNNDTYNYNLNRLKLKAMSMFKWKNLPSEIDERYIELMLMQIGYVCFFKVDEKVDVNSNIALLDGTYFALQCTLGGRYNVYNLPTEYQINTASGFHTERDKSNSVIIYNNNLHQPTLPTLMLYAKRITNVERTIDVNLNKLKRPYIYIADDSQVMTMKKLFEDIENNEDLILSRKNIEMTQLESVSNITPNNTIDLFTLKKRFYNECLNDIGIKSLASDKKERLVSDEVTANDEDVLVSRYSMLNARKMACKQINEMFGLNIDVEFREDIVAMEDLQNDESMEDEKMEVENG